MELKTLLRLLRRFTPADFTFQDKNEHGLKPVMIETLEKEGDFPLSRDRACAHFTASSMIFNPAMDRVLMVFHNIYQSISWTGGHADGEWDLLSVAIREAKEETGIKEVFPLSSQILSIDVLPVIAHKKHGKEVPAHEHFSVAFGLIAPDKQPLQVKPDENSAVEWIPIEHLAQRCAETHMLPVYQKLIVRMRALQQKKQQLYRRLAPVLLGWYKVNARDLPWRKDRDPYHVWLSEIMLQQTRVEAVKAYYKRFLAAFPTVEDLAAGEEAQLMKLWEGLGYYNRARNLQKTAKIISTEYDGVLPGNYDLLIKLPGIGEYTAGAVASICYDLPAPAVDGNVLRVVSRITENFENINKPSLKKAVTQELRKCYWEPSNDGRAEEEDGESAEVGAENGCVESAEVGAANGCVESAEVGAANGCVEFAEVGAEKETIASANGVFTQSLMELGAIVCVPNGVPKCEICPCNGFCMAYKNETFGQLPQKEKKNPRKVEEKTVFVLRTYDGRIAVKKRPAKGLLAGLWEFPNVTGILTEREAIEVAAKWGTKPLGIERSVRRTHIFSHVEWQMLCYYLICAEPEVAGAEITAPEVVGAEIAEQECCDTELWKPKYEAFQLAATKHEDPHLATTKYEDRQLAVTKHEDRQLAAPKHEDPQLAVTGYVGSERPILISDFLWADDGQMAEQIALPTAFKQFLEV